MRANPVIFCIGAMIAAGLAVSAATPTVQGLPPIKFTETRLENGLRVIIAEDHYAPVYAIAVSYDVGSRDERQGRTGFAHLFEHMMFKGSENVGPGEHFFLIFNNGGNMNGTTNTDRTIVLRDHAEEPARSRPVPGSRPHAVAGHHQGEPGQPAAGGSGRAAAGLDNQPYGKTYEKIDELATTTSPTSTR